MLVLFSQGTVSIYLILNNYKYFTAGSMMDSSNLLVTASHAIFHKEDNKEAPVAVVGYQFQHSALHALFRNITTNVSILVYTYKYPISTQLCHQFHNIDINLI